MNMKKITMEAVSLVVLAGFISCANAETAAPAPADQQNKPAATAPENTEITAGKSEVTAEPVAEKLEASAPQNDEIVGEPQQVAPKKAAQPSKSKAAPQIGGKTDAVRGRGLPKAFSGEGQ